MKRQQNNKIDIAARLIQDYYKTKNISGINRLVKRSKIDTINQSLISIGNPEVILFLLIAVNKNKTSSIFRYLPNEIQDEIINIATNNQIKIIFSKLFPDEILDIANRDKDNFKKILLNLSTEQRLLVKKIDKFKNDEAGSIMNPEFLVFRDNWTIKRCIQCIKEISGNIEELNFFYVCDKNGCLLGSVDSRDLFFAKNYNSKISTILNDSFISVKPNDDIENIINLFQEYHLTSLPVVDNDNNMLGIINNNDILPAIEEEVTEDIYNMYGIQKTDESYMYASIWKIIKSRLLWIVILMISATITSIVITLFEQWGTTITAGLSTILLVPILPVITGTSGNTGSQAFATTVRSLAVGDVTPKEYKKMIYKEFRIGLILGMMLALINFVRLCLYFLIPQFRLGTNGPLPYSLTIFVALATSISLWIAIVLAKLLGACLPIIATKLKLDPTVMCGPLIATLLDIISTTLLFIIGILIITTVQPILLPALVG